jgi:hypothetical protein
MSGDLYPKYEVQSLEGGGGWSVVVTPSEHKTPYHLYGFVSEAEARDWIRKEMNGARGQSMAE